MSKYALTSVMPSFWKGVSEDADSPTEIGRIDFADQFKTSGLDLDYMSRRQCIVVVQNGEVKLTSLGLNPTLVQRWDGKITYHKKGTPSATTYMEEGGVICLEKEICF